MMRIMVDMKLEGAMRTMFSTSKLSIPSASGSNFGHWRQAIRNRFRMIARGHHGWTTSGHIRRIGITDSSHTSFCCQWRILCQLR